MDQIIENVTIQTIVFGSCHKNSYVSRYHPKVQAEVQEEEEEKEDCLSSSFSNSSKNSCNTTSRTIWHSILHKTQPDIFLWLGDSVYSPHKIEKDGIASLETLEREYNLLLYEKHIGYNDFLQYMNHHHRRRRRHSNDTNMDEGRILGTWDDHDYGGNDYGKEMKEKLQRRDLFLHFLSTSNQIVTASSSSSSHENKEKSHENDEKKKNKNSTQQHETRRQGVYSARTYHVPSSYNSSLNSSSILILSLDTRSGRDLHIIPSWAGNTYFPKLGSIVASFTRWLTAAFYYTHTIFHHTSTNTSSRISSSQHHRVILDDEQWIWLEQYLTLSPTTTTNLPNVILILSSIQVLTTNPLFESWGHFPQEKYKLLHLVNTYSKDRKERNPKDSFAILFLSGDVHHGEILDSSTLLSLHEKKKKKKMNSSSNSNGRMIEVTSSGMTHSISNSFYGTIVTPALHIFSSHRYQSTTRTNDSKKKKKKKMMMIQSSSFLSDDYFYLGRNYGSIQIDWSNNKKNNGTSSVESQLQINIHNHLGDIVLSTNPQPLSYYSMNMTDEDLYHIAYSCLNGHVIKGICQGITRITMWNPILVVFVMVFCMNCIRWWKKQEKQRYHHPMKKRKSL